MGNKLIEVKNLSILFRDENGNHIRAVSEINLGINKNESIGIIGETGSGKTSLALSIMGYSNKNAEVKGNIIYEDVDILTIDKVRLNNIRWKDIGMVFQNSLDVLNPLLTVDEQIKEVLNKINGLTEDEKTKRVNKLLIDVSLPLGTKNLYPHELSGGMRQRVLIAMGIACEPKVLIIDEPTSSLDNISKEEILKLLDQMRKDREISMLVISHEFDVVDRLTDKINIMYKGKIMERGNTKDVLDDPQHIYTRGLINSTSIMNPYSDIWGIREPVGSACNKGCVFYDRCTQRELICKEKDPALESIGEDRLVSCIFKGLRIMLKADHISKKYRSKDGDISACNNCGLEVRYGEIVSLVGESGSGKTTFGTILAGLLEKDSGEVYFEEEKVEGNKFTKRKRGIQMIYQDPYTSLNENLTIYDVVSEPLVINKDTDIEEKVNAAISDVGFIYNKEFMGRKVYTLSGGERQRISIARSLTMEPKLLIADEITSMLDVSTKANVIRMLKGLQNKNGFSMVYITHDIEIAKKISDRIYIMKEGFIVQEGSVNKIYEEPMDNYVKGILGMKISEKIKPVDSKL